MTLPVELDRKLQRRFDELSDEADALLAHLNEYDHNHLSRYQEWVVKTSGLILVLFGDTSERKKYQKIMERYPGQTAGTSSQRWKQVKASVLRKNLATLKGLKDNYVNGFLSSMQEAIVANMSADYMEQAEALLGEEIQGKYSLRLAAMLGGVVLETRLRSYCQNLDPPVETVKPNGESKTLGALIGELDKVQAFDNQTRKLLRAWADIRNAAAHEGDNAFTREQVELMLLGVNGFFANHL